MALRNRLVQALIMVAAAMPTACSLGKYVKHVPDDALSEEYGDWVRGLKFVAAIASEAEQAEAREEARRHREAQAERIDELEAETRLLAVQVNERGDRVIVDPETGEPVDDKVYRAPEPAPEPPDASTSEAPTAETEPTEPTEGELGGYNVVFVPRRGG
jgi:hypothetical protein